MSEPRAGCIGWLARLLRGGASNSAAAGAAAEPDAARTSAWRAAAERGDWRCLAELVRATRDSDFDRADAASEALAQLVPRIPAARLRDAAQAMRADDTAWKALGLSTVAHYDTDAHVAGLLALTLHSSGHVRERALRAVAHRAPDPVELPFLIERAVDSVQPVRMAAETAIARHLAPVHARAWAAQLEQLQHLQRRERAEAARLFGSVAKLLLAPGAGAALEDALRAGSRAVAEAALAIAGTAEPARLAAALEIASAHADPFVRAHAVRAWLRVPASAARDACLERARTDRSLFVRREVLRAAVDLPAAERRARVHGFLLDPCAALRFLARHLWKQVGDGPAEAPLELYRSALSDADARIVAAAASGIGECGSAADAALLEPLVEHASPRVASAAVRAIAQLDGPARVAWLAVQLDASAAGVGRAAAAWLAKLGGADPAVLRTLVARARHARARRRAAALLLARARYDALVDALELAGHSDPELAQQARAWLERLGPTAPSHAPTPEQEQRIRAALARSGPALAQDMRAKIERLLWGSK
ncbi:MAG: hypothetical protein EPO68_03660 [Planctomycetota bacterium]|nr:MAG: hypothetical protein EPO68_03660 [Planctomycetota bacterium]